MSHSSPVMKLDNKTASTNQGLSMSSEGMEDLTDFGGSGWGLTLKKDPRMGWRSSVSLLHSNNDRSVLTALYQLIKQGNIRKSN
ncbi:hypothetical protein JTB14_012003 [Gonioctena quinquepunctata]|nr:hypothetical protein JTB14_012003 [Gonioctena quinquepunctata]